MTVLLNAQEHIFKHLSLLPGRWKILQDSYITSPGGLKVDDTSSFDFIVFLQKNSQIESMHTFGIIKGNHFKDNTNRCLIPFASEKLMDARVTNFFCFLERILLIKWSTKCQIYNMNQWAMTVKEKNKKILIIVLSESYMICGNHIN